MTDSRRPSIDHQRLLREVLADTPATQGLADRPPPPSPTELTPHFPDFEILALVGRGGMGAVYKAVQKRLGRTVALKVMPKDLGAQPEFRERFEREARVLATLNHPHVIAVHDFGVSGGFCYLVTEFVDGVDLRRLMALGQLSPQEALRIAPQVCEGLQYAHERGVVHRDVKPENILIDTHGQVKIADFGLAKVIEAGASPVALTRSTAVLGTPHYMAPEQWRGSGAVDHRADIYALGVVLYEMLTGELPLGAYEPPSRREGVPPGLDEVVRRALAQRPENRYQAAREVQRDVEQRRATPMAGERSAMSSTSSSSAAAVPVAPRRGGLTLGSLIALLLLLMLVFTVLIVPAMLMMGDATSLEGEAQARHYEAFIEGMVQAKREGSSLVSPETTLFPSPPTGKAASSSIPELASLVGGGLLLQMLVAFGALRRRRNSGRGPRGLAASVVIAWLVPALAFVAVMVAPASLVRSDDLQIVFGVALAAAGVALVVRFLRHEVRRQRQWLAEGRPARAGVSTWLGWLLVLVMLLYGGAALFVPGSLRSAPVSVARGPMLGRDLIDKPVEYVLQRLGAPKAISGSGGGQQWTYPGAAPEELELQLSVHDGVVLAAPLLEVLLVGGATDRTPHLGQRVGEVTRLLGAPTAQIAGPLIEEWQLADGTSIRVHQARVVGIDHH